jgi:hypothetical protein
MTFDSLGIWLGTLAGLVGTLFLVLDWSEKRKQRAKPETTPVDKEPLWTPNRRFGFLTAIVLLAWAVTLFNFIERRWFTPGLPVEYAVTGDNAILDVQREQEGTNPEVQKYFVNMQIVNSGKATALGMQHLGVVAYADGTVDPFTIGSQFDSLKTQFKFIPFAAAAAEIRPGANNIWFTVFGPPVKDEITKNLDAGKAFLYVFNIMRYRDDKIGSNQFIYSEHCTYFVKQVTHFCESGHNRTYISD